MQSLRSPLATQTLTLTLVTQAISNLISDLGWSKFTDQVIKKLNENKEGIVYLLWGGVAQAKEALIDTKKHHVLKCGHPSPLSAKNFFGCGHFLQTNKLLGQQVIFLHLCTHLSHRRGSQSIGIFPISYFPLYHPHQSLQQLRKR